MLGAGAAGAAGENARHMMDSAVIVSKICAWVGVRGAPVCAGNTCLPPQLNTLLLQPLPASDPVGRKRRLKGTPPRPQMSTLSFLLDFQPALPGRSMCQTDVGETDHKGTLGSKREGGSDAR